VKNYEATLQAVRDLSEHRVKRGSPRNYRRIKRLTPLPPPPPIALPH